jgi:hypothetical protein
MKAGVAGLSGTLALVLLLPMEAGVPIPVPADLVTFAVGERVAAGRFPLWLAVTGFRGHRHPRHDRALPGVPDPVRPEPGDEQRVLVS